MNALVSGGGGFGNRRSHPRIDVGQPMILISVSGRIDGEMRDLSRYGARVRLRNAPPQRGRDVLLRWGSHEIFGHVVWSEGVDAGIAFHKPFADDELADTLGDPLPVAMPAERKLI
jgi:hypothetical protein